MGCGQNYAKVMYKRASSRGPRYAIVIIIIIISVISNFPGLGIIIFPPPPLLIPSLGPGRNNRKMEINKTRAAVAMLCSFFDPFRPMRRALNLKPIMAAARNSALYCRRHRSQCSDDSNSSSSIHYPMKWSLCNSCDKRQILSP